MVSAVPRRRAATGSMASSRNRPAAVPPTVTRTVFPVIPNLSRKVWRSSVMSRTMGPTMRRLERSGPSWGIMTASHPSIMRRMAPFILLSMIPAGPPTKRLSRISVIRTRGAVPARDPAAASAAKSSSATTISGLHSLMMRPATLLHLL